MSDDEPPAKRRRTGDTQDDPPKKSETYWFEDGNIVLKASGATSGETLYRVHSSIFARHSEVFKDMLSIPQPSKKAEAEMIDGCPIISLTDAKYDIENMISIFYDNKWVYATFDPLDTYLLNKKRIDEFRGQLRVLMVESMLRLGNKYAITHLEEEALFRLHHDYPQDLVSWDAMMNELVQPLIETDHHVITWIIKIAHEFDLNTILPAAYSAYIKAVESMVCAFWSWTITPWFIAFFNRTKYLLPCFCLRRPKSAVSSDTLKC